MNERDPGDDSVRDPGGGYVIGPTEGGPDVDVTPHRDEARATRSDGWIREQILQRLAASSLAKTPIDVDVHHGDVVLRGTVNGPAGKHLAEQIAESVAGSRCVRSELELSAPLSGARRRES